MFTFRGVRNFLCKVFLVLLWQHTQAVMCEQRDDVIRSQRWWCSLNCKHRYLLRAFPAAFQTCVNIKPSRQCGRQCHIWFIWLMSCWTLKWQQHPPNGLRKFKLVCLLLVFVMLTLQGTKCSFSTWKLHNDFLLSSYRNSVTTFLQQTLWKIHLRWNTHSWTFKNIKIKGNYISSTAGTLSSVHLGLWEEAVLHLILLVVLTFMM